MVSRLVLRFCKALVLSCALSCARTGSAKAEVPTVTLAQVLARARTEGRAVLSAVATLARIRAEEQLAKAVYVPLLSVEGGTGTGYDNRETTPNKIRVPDYVPADQRRAYVDAARTPRYEASSFNKYAQLDVDYTLVDGARRGAVRSASENTAAGRAATRGAQRSAMLAGAELYFESLAAVQLVHDAELTRARRTEQHQAIQALVRAGLRPPVDAARAEIELVAARHAFETRTIEANATFAALAAAIGGDPQTPVRPSPFDDNLWPAPDSPSVAITRAIGQRPEVQRSEAIRSARRAEHSSAVGACMPKLGLTGRAQVNHSDILSGTGIEGASYVASGSIYLRWTALDAQVWRRAKVASGASKEAELALESTLLAVRSEVVAADYAVLRAGSALRQAVEVLAAAEVTRVAQKERYGRGLASLLELLDAEETEQNARRQRIEAERAERLARLRLLAATGELERLAR